MILLAGLASAAPIITDISNEHPIAIAGLWGLPVFTETGWMMGVGAGGGFLIGKLNIESWTLENTIELSTRGDLKDHSLARCLDGSWLHVSTADGPDIKANPVFRYEPGFQVLAEGEVENEVPAHSINDGIAICTGALRAAGFAQEGGEADYLYRIGPTGSSIGRRITLTDAPRLTGAGYTPDRCDLSALHIAGFDGRPELVISTYSHDLQHIARHELTPPNADDVRYYWPTGFMAVEGGYLLALMGQDREAGWDNDEGNVYLWVISESFVLLETHKLSNFSAKGGSGGMRPWLDLDAEAEGGPLLLVSIDKDRHPLIYTARVNLEALAEHALDCEPGDTGADTAEAASPRPPSSGHTESTIGCRATAAGLLLPVWAWRRGARRRSRLAHSGSGRCPSRQR